MNKGKTQRLVVCLVILSVCRTTETLGLELREWVADRGIAASGQPLPSDAARAFVYEGTPLGIGVTETHCAIDYGRSGVLFDRANGEPLRRWTILDGRPRDAETSFRRILRSHAVSGGWSVPACSTRTCLPTMETMATMPHNRQRSARSSLPGKRGERCNPSDFSIRSNALRCPCGRSRGAKSCATSAKRATWRRRMDRGRRDVAPLPMDWRATSSRTWLCTADCFGQRAWTFTMRREKHGGREDFATTIRSPIVGNAP